MEKKSSKVKLQEVTRNLMRLEGNARACVMVEPLFIIPHNLFITYTSVYMVALGCTDKQIGLIASVSLIFQMFFSIIGGYVTDKLGRKRTSLIFDLISWCIPTLIWAVAQNFYFFLVAAIINSLVRIVHTSWSCLLIEDTPPEDRVHVFSWIQVAGILAGFVAPIGGLLVRRFELVPAVRGLYFFAFISMTTMVFLRNHLVNETKQGIARMKEAKNENFLSSMDGYKSAIKKLISTPYTMVAFLLSVFTNINNIIRMNFFAIVLTQKLEFSQQSLSFFPVVQSAIMLLVYLFVMPALGKLNFKKPLMSAFAAMVLSNLLLVFSPKQSFLMIILSTTLTAYGTAVSFPFVESILANSIDDNERAKTMSILFVILYGLTAPFGYIGGILSSVSEELPFVMMIAIFIICLFLVGLLSRLEKKQIKDTIRDEALEI
ncbi:MAG: MFS transporter [Clostridiales bacterium]|nr:MFS transporter [Clostridiales bacterium]